MHILQETVSREDLKIMAAAMFGDLVKAVVDVDRAIIAVDAELHSDLEALLLENGSRQHSLWGINFYPALTGDDFIEFDSMINIRPSHNNRSRGVDDPKTREKIAVIVNQWVNP